MNTKILSNKLGLKSGPPKPDPELEKLKKENAALKKKLDDFSRSKEKMSDVERSRLLEKILALETLKVKNAQEITRQNEEIQNLKDSLKSKLNGHIAAAEKDSRMMAKLAQDLGNQMPAGPSSSQAAAPQNPQVTTNGGRSSVDILEGQLKDALEKNQQWLSYDQQRETYVQGLMARIFELEQQLATLNKKLQQQDKDATSEAKQDEKQKYYDKLLLTAKKELDEEKKQSALLNAELSASRAKHEAHQKEMEDLSASLRSVRDNERQLREDDRKRMKDKVMRLKIELEMCKDKAEEEKKRSSELSDQVQVMQKSLLKHQEDEKRVAALEQQIQRCSSDFENEKIDRQKVQHQLYKVLKELRKAREQITRLEPTDVQICTLVWPSTSEEIAWDISFVVLNFMVPGLSIVISYTKIYKITKETRDRLITSTAYSETHQLKVSQRDFKLFRTLLILMVSFFVMWTPVIVIILLLLVQNLHYGFAIPPTLFLWITVFTFCNSFVNPILYNINLFRKKWWKIIFFCSVDESTDTDTLSRKNATPNISTALE